jgi:hypothetical protein
VPFTELDPELEEEEEAALDLLPEDEREEKWAEMITLEFDLRIREARVHQQHALESWPVFAETAAAELRRGLVPRLRRDADLIRRG